MGGDPQAGLVTPNKAPFQATRFLQPFKFSEIYADAIMEDTTV